MVGRRGKVGLGWENVVESKGVEVLGVVEVRYRGEDFFCWEGCVYAVYMVVYIILVGRIEGIWG